ncbi:MAG TPA: hypothetical protein VIL95_05385 [Bacillota bacterium]
MELPSGLPVGSQAPEVTLIGMDNQPVRLRDKWEKQPVVFVFYHLAFTGG